MENINETIIKLAKWHRNRLTEDLHYIKERYKNAFEKAKEYAQTRDDAWDDIEKCEKQIADFNNFLKANGVNE